MKSCFKLWLIFCITFPKLAQAQDEDRWAYNKKLLVGYESEVLEVLKHYPELRETRIRFKYKRLKDAFMQSQPTVWSLLFKRKSRRLYIIYANVLPSYDLSLEDIPREVLKGIVAHELAHIVYYNQTSALRLITDFIRYPINCPFKKSFERSTDVIAIEHGMGEYLKKAWQYIGFDAPLDEVFKAKKRFYYLSPIEIDKIIQKKYQDVRIQDDTL